MYIDLTPEDRAWIAEKIQKRVPASLKNDPQFAAAISQYIETGSAQGFLWERFGKVIDYLQKSLISGNIHDPQGRETFLEQHAYQFIELNGGEYLRQFQQEFAAAFPNPQQVTEAQKNAFAYHYQQRESLAYMQGDAGQEMLQRMTGYMQEHGMPPMDNPRALRRYFEGAARASYPDAPDAQIQQMVDLNMGMVQESIENERRESRRQGCSLWGFFLVPLIGMLVLLGVLLLGVYLYAGDNPVVNGVNWVIFAVVGGVSLFFYLRRNLDTHAERMRLVWSALLIAVIGGAVWYFGLIDIEAGELSLREDPDLLVIAILAMFGGVMSAVIWLKRNVFRLLLWVAILGMLIIAATIAWQQGWLATFINNL